MEYLNILFGTSASEIIQGKINYAKQCHFDYRFYTMSTCHKCLIFIFQYNII